MQISHYFFIFPQIFTLCPCLSSMFTKTVDIFSILSHIIFWVIIMMNYIWGFMVIISFVISAIRGNVSEVTAASLEGAKEAITTIIGLLGIMCFWTGLTRIAEKSGLTAFFETALRPLTHKLFPKLPKNSPAMTAISMNMTANLLGMGNAATPLGLKAMEELNKLNKFRDTASDEMCTFAVINTASIQLIPSTIISLRQMYGSQNPGEIILPVWICSILALVAGVTVSKILEKRSRL